VTILFISKGCKTCEKILLDIDEEKKSKLLILEVAYDKEKNIFRVYDGSGKPIGEEAPVDIIPTLYYLEEKEVYTGYKEIMEKLDHE
jgi:hypothetical protein